MNRFINWLFGCRHKRETWPLTVNGRTYRVCTGCGHERDVPRLEVLAIKAAK